MARRMKVAAVINAVPILLLAVFLSALSLSACQTPGADVKPASNEKAAAEKPAPAPVAKNITPDAARNLAQNCFACHGPNGRSPGSIPSLSNLSAYAIARKMRQFKDDDSFSTVMGRQAKGYSDAEIEAMANYIASLKNKETP